MGKVCSYCDKEKALTKEHIWPKGFIDRADSDLLAYNKKLNRLINTEPVIKDVCAECNNEKLSSLDGYLCTLYDKYFTNIIEHGQPAEFSCDYDKLLRGLLKISYNSARTQKQDHEKIKLHSKCSNYILGQSPRPPHIALRMLIVTTSTMYDIERLDKKEFRPDSLRCADIPYDGKLSNSFQVRLIGIRSYWFYLILSKKRESKAKWNRFHRNFENWLIQPGQILSGSMSKLKIPVNETTYMHPNLLGMSPDTGGV